MGELRRGRIRGRGVGGGGVVGTHESRVLPQLRSHHPQKNLAPYKASANTSQHSRILNPKPQTLNPRPLNLNPLTLDR